MKYTPLFKCEVCGQTLSGSSEIYDQMSDFKEEENERRVHFCKEDEYTAHIGHMKLIGFIQIKKKDTNNETYN